ncbi:putative RNA-binding protein EEED8.10 isoform X2 [Stomoxys calcitrans]|uniref:putative RNA-binding protein EEED8.10 isoform X2 n=1 Tax=Stomoxys calcitrans TaxID=35570 RepID=UPI0027E2B584|nr:putative RNA-binding protein EEED8.10 isoform X2 [Stomoxys calcitrans]
MGFDGDEENFKIVNGQAFTEDNMLVHNLFVYNIPIKTTTEQFLTYFKKFGEIKNVRLLNDNKKRRNVQHHHQTQKIGFVNFCDAKVAAKVLQNKNHAINKKRIGVRACDSWHQPGALGKKDASGATDNSSSEQCQQEALILNLNDDCLDLIFKNLPLLDQINFARTCRRLKDVFTMHSKACYKHFLLPDLEKLTLWQTRQFLEMAGPCIEVLTGQLSYKQTNRIIEFLGLFCTNVKTLQMTKVILKPKNLRKLLKNMTKIEALYLGNTELCDSCIPILKNLPNLKTLGLERNTELTGRFIKELTSIERLYLNGCHSLRSRYFKNICESLTELNDLEIEECILLKSMNLAEMVKCLNKLETLKLGFDSAQLHHLALLPKLKHLSLDCSFVLQTNLFTTLAEHKADQLETLILFNYQCLDFEKICKISELKKLKKIICPSSEKLDDACMEMIATLPHLEVLCLKNCQRFTGKGLLEVIKHCHKLRTINIWNCKQLTEQFAKDCLQQIKGLQTQRDKPLTIYAYRSGIEQFTTASAEFEEARNMLEFTFKIDRLQISELILDYSDHDDFYDIDYSDDDDDDDDYEDDDDMFDHIDLDDDDYYMYYSDPDDDEDDIEFQLFRHALFGPPI